MLIELDIVNLAVIDHVRLGFGPGLNVLTGETGAGKSIVMDALGLLVGGRADAGMIRSGATGATVEGFFDLAPLAGGPALATLNEAGLVSAEDDVLIVSRELAASGRNVCRVNGRAVPLRILQEVGEHLVDIHGQGASVSLLRVAEHVELLDRWAGLTELRRQSVTLRNRLRRLRRELADLRGDERELARRADLLRHQIEEIGLARLQPGEEEELRHAQRLNANAEQILHLAGAAYQALSGGADEGTSARDLLGVACQVLAELERIDPAVCGFSGPASQISLQLEELAGGLRAYRDSVEYDPARLAEIEDRLGLIFALKRKYGASLAEVLAFAEGAATELAALDGRDRAIGGLEAQEVALLRELGAVTGELSAGRRRAADSLERRVEEQLATLAMSGRFAVHLGEDAEGPGGEPVEFLLSLNPGEPPRPLVKIASGGETSRVMLAIKAALAGSDPHPILVFDEIDSGIGGRVGDVVGRKLWELGRHSQVLAVTHLPQIAAQGDVHLQVAKLVEGGRTVTRVASLSGEARVNELSDMFGSERQAGRLQAAALLARAERHSQEAVLTGPEGSPRGAPE
ncbi:MAG: DNA repair protein RecN [Actinomycetota bacterium]